MIDNPKFGNMDKTGLDMSGEMPEVIPGNRETSLKGDSSSAGHVRGSHAGVSWLQRSDVGADLAAPGSFQAHVGNPGLKHIDILVFVWCRTRMRSHRLRFGRSMALFFGDSCHDQW